MMEATTYRLPTAKKKKKEKTKPTQMEVRFIILNICRCHTKTFTWVNVGKSVAHTPKVISCFLIHSCMLGKHIPLTDP